MKKAQAGISIIVSLFVTSILRIPLGIAFTQMSNTDTSSWHPVAADLWGLLPAIILISIFIMIAITIWSLLN